MYIYVYICIYIYTYITRSSGARSIRMGGVGVGVQLTSRSTLKHQQIHRHHQSTSSSPSPSTHVNNPRYGNTLQLLFIRRASQSHSSPYSIHSGLARPPDSATDRTRPALQRRRCNWSPQLAALARPRKAIHPRGNGRSEDPNYSLNAYRAGSCPTQIPVVTGNNPCESPSGVGLPDAAPVLSLHTPGHCEITGHLLFENAS
jgi:hypothetical protein